MRVGEKYINKFGNSAEIVKYKSTTDCDILIDGYELKEHVQYWNIKKGMFKSSLLPSVCGVGYIGIGSYKSSDENNNKTNAYSEWIDMLKRCYDKNRWENHPTYKGVEVCGEWLDFQQFACWYYENSVDNSIKYEIDKDILGGKLYSPKTCILIPHILNIVLSRNPKRINNTLPVGVEPTKGCINKYTARIVKDGEKIIQHGFTNSMDAFEWYKSKKEEHIREIAEKYKNQITERAYKAILSYEVQPFPYKEVI